MNGEPRSFDAWAFFYQGLYDFEPRFSRRAAISRWYWWIGPHPRRPGGEIEE